MLQEYGLGRKGGLRRYRSNLGDPRGCTNICSRDIIPKTFLCDAFGFYSRHVGE